MTRRRNRCELVACLLCAAVRPVCTLLCLYACVPCLLLCCLLPV